jgi:hypothetical protein
MHMADRIRSSLTKVLKQLHLERARIERQVSALSAAIGQLGGSKKKASRKAGQRRRRAMSAVQKRAVSKRMKAYWAKRRAAKTAA